MNTTTELFNYGLANEEDYLLSLDHNKIYINFNKFLVRSYNEYSYYLVTYKGKLSRFEKNQLGIHFILNQLLKCLKIERGIKKHFYYKIQEHPKFEHRLLKQVFNTLPTPITMADDCFDDFVSDAELCGSLPQRDNFSFWKFKTLLKKYGAIQMESLFLGDVNVKYSMYP